MDIRNDEPTLVDQLRRKSLVSQVGRAAAICSPPQVLGVHGDWGLGKTSFLQQVQYYLSGICAAQSKQELANARNNAPRIDLNLRDRTTVVWFEAWRYQHEENPIVALLHEMRGQLEWAAKLKRGIRKTAEVAFLGTLMSMESVTKKIGLQASKVREEGERWERENLAVSLPAHTIRTLLTEVIGQLIGREGRGPARKRGLVVIIDDLDRCEPAAIYRLLEGLKLYLSIENCVFILGMDQRQVIRAIAAMQPESQENQDRLRWAADYLEKLCQNVWRLPSIADPKDFLCRKLPAGSLRDRVDTAIGDIRCLPGNPRRLTGLANLVLRLDGRQGPEGDHIYQTRLMLIVAYVYQFHPDLCVRWRYDPDFFELILDWVKGTGQRTGPLENLIRPDNYIAEDETPTPRGATEEVRKLYPDPSASNVFWIQRLIVAIIKDVQWEHFKPYFSEPEEK